MYSPWARPVMGSVRPGVVAPAADGLADHRGDRDMTDPSAGA